MSPENTLYSIIMLLGAAHGLFLGLILLSTGKFAGTGRIYLALFTLAFALDLGHEYLYQSRYLLNFLGLAFIDPIVNLVYGPCLYLYTRALTQGTSFKFSSWQGLHGVPVSMAVIVVLFLPELNPQQFTAIYYAELENLSGPEISVQKTISSIALTSVFTMGLYLYCSIRLLGVHASAVRQQFSALEKITLNWLRSLLIAFAILFMLLVLDGFFSGLFGLNDQLNKLLYLGIVVVIYAMGYLGMRQSAIFTGQKPLTLVDTELHQPKAKPVAAKTNAEAGNDETVTVSKYQKSALDAAASAVLCEELKRYMEIEKPHLENRLNLSQLADLMNITPNYLSQVINEQLQINFFDFINGYRIEEAKTMLEDPGAENLSVVTIAYQAGFNSKSAFYSAFKKFVGCTPNEYRKTSAGGMDS